ncbi:MAG: amidase, partial [bacterium]
MNLEKLTITKIKRGLQSKEYSAVDLAKAYLDRIAKLDEQLDAFITVCGDFALERACWADEQIAKDKDAFKKYPLLGVPYSAKDLFCTKGIKTTAASNVLKDFVPEYSATVIERLENAGAVLLGKNNCDAWAHGSSTENSDFFTTKNPWNTAHLPGGSSGGSAAAVAAGQAPFAVGTETGGSIRQPSAWCGITGLKPTYGAVSRYGVVAMASSLDSPGPMAQTVSDARAVFDVIRGKDPYDATNFSITEPVLSLSKEPVLSLSKDRPAIPKKIKIGLP